MTLGLKFISYLIGKRFNFQITYSDIMNFQLQ